MAVRGAPLIGATAGYGMWLAALHGVLFYVALPASTIDWSVSDGVAEIPIEERGPEEVTHLTGWGDDGVRTIRITPPETRAGNPAFDVTPARLVTGLITERGLCAASEAGLQALFPEQA